MPISVSCPSCGKNLSAPDSSAGKRAKCPGCGQIMTIPEVVLDAESVGTRTAGPPTGLGSVSEPPSTDVASGARQPCPECGEMIVVGAAKCRFCNAIFDPNLKRMKLGGRDAGWEDLRQIASYQRGVIFCILFYFLAIGLAIGLPKTLAFIPGLLFIAQLSAALSLRFSLRQKYTPRARGLPWVF